MLEKLLVRGGESSMDIVDIPSDHVDIAGFEIGLWFICTLELELKQAQPYATNTKIWKMRKLVRRLAHFVASTDDSDYIKGISTSQLSVTSKQGVRSVLQSWTNKAAQVPPKAVDAMKAGNLAPANPVS